MELINLQNISRVYGEKDNIFEALKNINLSINSGELIAIVGPSGSGKSTLLNVIGTLDTYNSGNYILKGVDIGNFKSKKIAEYRNKIFGFVVQHFALINEYTVYENIEVPLKYANVSKKERKNKINKLLEHLELSSKYNKYPTELSGGQCQRVAIARALVNNPDIILADEPTGALDQSTGEMVMNIFKELNKKGKTVIIITHDEKVADQCNRVIRIQDGCIS
ncbi:MAG: ABC transporter ATP-binding protein [Sarcina sp.]